MVVAKVWKLVRRPEGLPTLDDFKCVEEELPPCNEGGLYVINLLSVCILTMYRTQFTICTHCFVMENV